MRVDGTYNAYKIFSGANSTGKLHKAGSGNSGGKDTFTLSVQAEDYLLARKAVAQAPDVRGDKVEDIKSRIAEGRYNVSASMVAEKILSGLVQP